MSRHRFRPRVEGLEDRLAPAIFNVINANNAGAGSLRAAIVNANNTAGPDSINFNIAASGVQKINLTSALPTITETATIDGTTQSGFVSTPVIVLNGAAAGGGVHGLTVAGPDADSCLIKGLVIQNFTGTGIVIFSNSNTVQGCFIGTNAAGTAGAGNGGSGITMLGTAASNTVGGAAALRNLISANGAHGVVIRGAGVTGNTVKGNYIGSNLAGNIALSNKFDGVVISQGATSNSVGDAATGNFIAGNNRHGVYIGGTGTQSNTVINNTIGSNLASGVSIVAGATNNTVGGAGPGLGSVIASNGTHGVVISGAGTSGNSVQGNFIGTTQFGTAALANAFDGVLLSGGARNNTIGGSVAGAGNLISGNRRFGVSITGSGTSANAVAGNIIGLNVSATSAVANGSSGVQIAAGAYGNEIGGIVAEARNVISGNTDHGILITGSSANVVIGNYIGTNATGTGAVANRFDGIVLSGGASNNSIGTAAAGSGNVISGNGRNGVNLTGAGTSGNAINGNTIGLQAGGASALPNSGHGVQVGAQAHGNTIGSPASGLGNTISGNTKSGILISGANNTVVQQNKIGTSVDGTIAIGNGVHGVFLTGGAANNLIGHYVVDMLNNFANTIANNAGVGVLIGSDPAAGFNTAAGTGNAVLGNSIFANGLRGIDLGAKNGVTPNDGIDSDGGPNRFQNYPSITAATINGLTIDISVALTSTPNSMFRIELFASVTADSSGFGEGKTFLGWLTVMTNAAGQATGTGTFDYIDTPGIKITATATNLDTNDTSEFSFAFNAV